jgi:hypothetical protein
MILKNWFAKESYIRLTEEEDGFVSTVCYSILHPKGLSLRFKRVGQFLIDGKAGKAHAEAVAPVRSVSKT